MEELRNIYKKRFFARRDSMNWRKPIMGKAIVEIFHPSSIVDVGCANGDILAGIKEIDQDIVFRGIEGSDQAIEFFEPEIKNEIYILDVRYSISFRDLNLIFPADLCISLEVAEHIEPEYAEQYIDNLCSLSDRILITAAPPGQGGHHHVNCQPKEYWIDKFHARGFFRGISEEFSFKRMIEPWKHKKGIKAYYDNALYFYKEDPDYLERTGWWKEMINR